MKITKIKLKKMKKVILLTLLLAISSCGRVHIVSAQNGYNKVKGNGKITTEKRTVSHFDKVSVNGSFDVVLRDGKEGQISIVGEENIIPYIETIVSDGLLNIKFKNNTSISYSEKLVISVPFEDINEVRLLGSGDVISKKAITAENVAIDLIGSGDMKMEVKAKNITVKLSGSGDIELSGKCDDYDCIILGSGDVNSFKLKAKNTTAKVLGTGNISTTTTKKIKATVSGSGNITYKGNPKYVDSNVSGSGDITAYYFD